MNTMHSRAARRRRRSRRPLHGPPPQPAEPGRLIVVQPLYRGASVALAVTLLSGCAIRQSRTPQQPSPPVNAAPPAAAPESLSEYMQKVRHLSANARPLNKNEAVETLETRDPAIAAELLLVSSQPTAERYRSLAERYRERGVLDAAYRNFNRAIALNPRDGAAYEGLARVWRDWGLPGLALGDAHRAIYYAPQSAIRPEHLRHGHAGTRPAMTTRARPTRRQAGSSRRRRTPSTIFAISRSSKGDSTQPSRHAGRRSSSTRQ